MNSRVSTYKLIKSLSPRDLYDILTRDKFSAILDFYKNYYNWEMPPSWPYHYTAAGALNGAPWFHSRFSYLLRSNYIYISDTGFSLLLGGEIAKKTQDEILSWNIFRDVYNSFYCDGLQSVGFNYTYEHFEILYREWNRNKIINRLIISG